MSSKTTTIVITSDTSGAKAGLQDAGSAVERFKSQVDRAGHHLSAGFNRVKDTIFSVQGALAALGVSVALRESILDFSRAESQVLRLNHQLAATGAISWTSGEQMQEFARRLGKDTLASIQDVNDAASIMLSFRQVTGDTFFEAIELAQDMAAVYRTDLGSATMQLAKALEDPVQGMTALRRSGTIFTKEQQEVVKSMVETGRQAEAMRLILDEVSRQVGGAAKAEAQGLAGALDNLSISAYDLRRAIGESLAPTVQEIAALFGEWTEKNKDLVATRVSSYVDEMTGSVKSLFRTLESMPEGVTKTAVLALLTGHFVGGPAGLGLKAATLGGIYMGHKKRQEFLEQHQDYSTVPNSFFEEYLGPFPPLRFRGAFGDPEDILEDLTLQQDWLARRQALIDEFRRQDREQALAAGQLEGPPLPAGFKRSAGDISIPGHQTIPEISPAKIKKPHEMSVADYERLARQQERDAEAAEAARLRELESLRSRYSETTLVLLPAEARAVEQLSRQYQEYKFSVIAAHDAGVIGQEQLRQDLDALADRHAEALADLSRQTEETFGDRMTSAIDGWATGYYTALNNMLWESELTFGNILESFGRMVTQMMIQESMHPLVKQAAGSIGSWIGDWFGGPRAAGGPVYPGKAYLVGERGPELFAPGAAGTIIPNIQSTPQVEVNVYNQGQPQAARAETRFDGQRVIVDLWLDAFNRNIGGMRTALGG